jgi:hypothetical protein
MNLMGKARKNRYLESDEWMETYRKTNWNTDTRKLAPGPPLKASFKQFNIVIFTVKLSYQGVTSSRMHCE